MEKIKPYRMMMQGNAWVIVYEEAMPVVHTDSKLVGAAVDALNMAWQDPGYQSINRSPNLGAKGPEAKLYKDVRKFEHDQYEKIKSKARLEVLHEIEVEKKKAEAKEKASCQPS